MLRVGTIGAGGTGRAHTRCLANIPDVEIVGVADVDIQRAQALVDEHGGKAFEDYRDLLAQGLDAVHICTPPSAHEEPVLAAAEAGTHIFLEKPIALSLDAADRMLQACRDHNVQLQIGFVLHYFPAFKKVHDVFAAGEIGELVAVWISRFGWGPGKDGWIADPAISGGMTVEFAAHDLDWLRWVGGDVRTVYGKNYWARGYGIEDHVWALLTFDKGCGLIGASWAATIGRNDIGILGTEGAVIYDVRGDVRMKKVDGEEQVLQLEDIPDGFLAEDQDFIRCVASGQPVPNPGETGRAALELSLAIQESSRTGNVVELPL